MTTRDENAPNFPAGSDEIENGQTGQSEPDELTGVLFECSPYGNLDAIVQHDQRSVYFYLHGDEPFGTRACWIRNLIEGPYVLSQQDMEAGLPPVMPRTHCVSAAPATVPDPQSLQIVWFEEGNAAALYENEELIAVIPPWSGTDGFHGYAAACAAESPLAWPLVNRDQLLKRLANARQFWDACASEERHPYGQLHTQLLEAYDQKFGSRLKYFALDGGTFPPRGAAVYRDGGGDGGKLRTVIVSSGMSFRPQPNVEMSVENPADLRRIELAIELPAELDEAGWEPFLKQLSGLVAYPWQAFTWFGPGHTCQFPAFAEISQFDSAKFVPESELNEGNAMELPDFREDPVSLLWLVPTESTAV